MRKILLTSLLVLILSGCSLFYRSQPPETNGDSLAEQDLPVLIEPDLVQFYMLDGSSGWGLTGAGILRTQDGGHSWHDVSPSGDYVFEPGSPAFFLDENSAWVLANPGPEAEGGALLYTADGGLNWQTFSPSFRGAQLFFIDDKHGWSLAITGVAAGSSGAEVYYTSDSGEHWKLVHRADDQSLQRGGQLPFSGTKNGLSFRDQKNGYLAGSVPAEGFVYLYETSDGGITWQPADIELPEALQASFLNFEAPMFFTPDQGKLVIHFQNPSESGIQVFTTNNGGERWIATNPVFISGPVDFASMQAGRVWDGEVLSATNDGGMVWVGTEPDLRPQSGTYQYQFVGADVGFALVIDLDGNHRFYRSGDGGADWVRLP